MGSGGGISAPPHLTAMLLVRVEVSDQPFIAACKANEYLKRGEMMRRDDMTIQLIKSQFQHRTPLFESTARSGLCLEVHLSSV